MADHSLMFEMHLLYQARPAVDAPAGEVAAWYEAKAALLDELDHHADAVVARAHAAALAGLPAPATAGEAR